MKLKWIFILSLIPLHSFGQLIKPKVKVPPSPLEKIIINEQFSYQPLDQVYKTLIKNYGLKIIYDSTYCKKRYFSYWFTGTPAPLAIEITTRDPITSYRPPDPMSFTIDSTLTIYIKHSKSIYYEDDGTIVQQEMPEQKKYQGPPQKKNFTLSGKTVDVTSGEPLPFAILKVKGTTLGTTSNADGFFTLLNVPSDTMTLSVNSMGYKSVDLYLNPEIQTNDFLIELFPSSNSLNEVVVVGNKEDLMKMSSDNLSMIKLSPAKLAELPNIGEKDIMRAFQLMPGVSAANESSSGLYVRGGTPDQNLVIYDGFTIYHVDHLYGFFSAFNANALKDVQLYKGGFESKFGGRLSSVMEITGKEGNRKQFNFGGDISLLSGNLFTEIPLTEKITILAAWRRSWKGPIYNWIFKSFNKDDNEAETQPTMGGGGPGGASTEAKTTSYFSDLNAKVTFRPTTKDNISYSYFYSIDKLDNSFSLSAPSFGGGGGNFSNGTTDLTRYGNIGMSLKWSRKWTDKLYGNTIVSYSNYFSDRDRSNERTTEDSLGNESTVKNGIFENNDLKDLSVKSDYEWDVFKGNKLEFGAFATSYDIQYTYSQDDTSNVLERKDNGLLMGGYLQDKYSFLHNRAEIKAGIRLSYFDITKQTYKEPRLSIGYKINEKLSLKASYGEYYQFANRITREDILSGSRDFWILSDGNKVPVSSSVHYIAGISYETKDYLFSAEGYYKKLYDVTEYSLRFTSSFRSTTVNENFYSGYGFAKGIELLAQKKSGKFTGWLSYTLGQANNHFDVYSTGYFPANQDVTNEFKMVGIYKYKRWDFAATWIFATGRPYTAPAGSYTITLLDGSTQDYFTVTNKNSLRLPDYHRLDLSVNYHILSADKKDIGYWGLSLFNAYNKTNIWYKQFSVSDGQIYETNVNYLGITPNLTLSLKIR
ncbi:MAG: TonB-dependent receptor [Bacteroidota bacterium]